MCEEGGCEGVSLTDSNVSSVYPARTRLVEAKCTSPLVLFLAALHPETPQW